MNPYFALAALVAALAAGAGGFRLGVDHATAASARENTLAAAAVTAATEAAAQAVASQKQVYTTIQGKVIRETTTNTVYADCRVPPAGMQLLQQALSGGAVGTGNRQLPQTTTPAE